MGGFKAYNFWMLCMMYVYLEIVHLWNENKLNLLLVKLLLAQTQIERSQKWATDEIDGGEKTKLIMAKTKNRKKKVRKAENMLKGVITIRPSFNCQSIFVTMKNDLFSFLTFRIYPWSVNVK